MRWAVKLIANLKLPDDNLSFQHIKRDVILLKISVCSLNERQRRSIFNQVRYVGSSQIWNRNLSNRKVIDIRCNRIASFQNFCKRLSSGEPFTIRIGIIIQ